MLNTKTIQACIIWACEQEVSAPKPGNVNRVTGGHNMQIGDFIKSAHAIAPALSQKGLSIGERVLAAIQATQSVVNCNTNLGIVLLFAPLCFAVEQCKSFEELPVQLKKALDNLTVQDAENTYTAIRLAHAGGLGEVADQDINSTPTITLLQAMEQAKNRDLIAAQYCNNYNDIFQIGLQKLTDQIICGETVEWATTFAYLYLLSHYPDTLIARKQGEETATKVSSKAQSFIDNVNNINKIDTFEAALNAWDNELKTNAINPGTTADLVASCLVLHSFQQAFALNRISV